MNLWLDDVRPAPIGWTHAKTADEAKAYLLTGTVERASLDHDLGACESCMERWRSSVAWAEAMPNCDHYGTGYTLVCWMEETGHWPRQKPTVHSANPVGSARMRQAIEKAYANRAA